MTTPTVKELLTQIAALQAQVTEVRKIEVVEAVKKVHALIDEHGLSAHDIFPSPVKSVKVGKKSAKAAPKYRDPSTGVTWSGRGLEPKWLQGKNRADFVIQA